MITQEMLDFYLERTRKHIERVGYWIDVIYRSNPFKYYQLLDRVNSHDQSKFEEPEMTPYIYITWRYHCKDTGKKFEVGENTERLIRNATYLHVKSCSHHPEFHDPTSDRESINNTDRDGIPKKIVIGERMTDIDIAEMVADWMSLSDERGGDPKDWADKNINKRWRFTEIQVEQIYGLLKLYHK